MELERINWNFRPTSYGGALTTSERVLNRVKGTARRAVAKEILETQGPQAVAKEIVAEAPDEGFVRAWGRCHPMMMGGEYLPPLEGNEVEIARIELASTTADVFSIRACEEKRRITYRVLDEYPENEQEYTLAIRSSREPLTLRQMVNFINKSKVEGLEAADHGLAFCWLVMNAGWGGSLHDLEGFVTVKSLFYPQLEPIFGVLGDRLMKKLRADAE